MSPVFCSDWAVVPHVVPRSTLSSQWCHIWCFPLCRPMRPWRRRPDGPRWTMDASSLVHSRSTRHSWRYQTFWSEAVGTRVQLKLLSRVFARHFAATHLAWCSDPFSHLDVASSAPDAFPQGPGRVEALSLRAFAYERSKDWEMA